MKCLKLLFLCWISSILTVTSCIRVDGYSCVTTYWDTVTCVVNITGIPVGQTNTIYNLTFTDTSGSWPTYHCPLVERNHTYSCVCKVTEGSVGDYYYDIDLCHESGCHAVTRDFKPSEYIQLTPPHKPEVQETPENFNITWISGYENHTYIKAVLDFELLLQRSQSTESKTLKATSQNMNVQIPRSTLKPYATYCIKVRSKTNPEYDGIWSKWSPSTCWKTEAEEVDGYSCVTTYWDTVTCVVNITGIPVGQTNTIYNLTFTDTYTDTSGSRSTYHCPLVKRNHTYSCVCKVIDDPYIGADNYYNIDLCHESGCHAVTRDFKPSEYIQLTPPHKPEVQETPENININWISGYENHLYLKTVLDFELLLQQSQSTESKTLKATSQNMNVQIPRSTLIKPDAPYCIKVRSKTNHLDYDGFWSKWSPSTCWKTEAKEEQDNTLVILIKSLVPLFVVVGVMLFLLYSPTARMKIKTLSHTPSPAPFFQPLFQQHGGDLQEWLSPKGKYVLAYTTEEILTTDDVIVVPKPITKEPEENVDYHNPTVHLTFTQCQSSYVGLPGVHEASPPLTMIYPGDTSYTQLPSSVWGVGVGEVEVASSPPEDVLNISCADSGCEDPTQSPECSLPNSPVEEIPPPCYCNDYCILNKTAEGFAPVLVSR